MLYARKILCSELGLDCSRGANGCYFFLIEEIDSPMFPCQKRLSTGVVEKT